jgi:hypothetical protein
MNADERQAIRERLVEHPKMALNHADALRLLDALDEAERRIKALEDDDLDEFIRERAADSSEFALHLLNNDLRARAELAEGIIRGSGGTAARATADVGVRDE